MSTRELLGNSRQLRIRVLAAIFVASLFALLAWWKFGQIQLATSTATVLVLDDSDSDFRNPPFKDGVIRLDHQSKLVKMVGDLNICQTVGGGRALASSPDGGFFVVCENVGGKLTAYELPTGGKLWSIEGEFNSAVVSRQGMTYALMSSGTIYGNGVVIVDRKGRIIKKGNAIGFDLALDADHDALWLVGKSITKCNLELEVLTTCDPIHWCAVSVAVDTDGCIWTAERQHPDVKGSKNRLLRISPKGEILKSIDLDWSPLCVRVDGSDGTMWATGVRARKNMMANVPAQLDRIHLGWIAGAWLRNILQKYHATEVTQKYDRQGQRLFQMKYGGNSIEIDPTDRSVWITGLKRLWHCAASGEKLGGYSGVSDSQKWVCVTAAAGETTRTR